jgi:hypothetical protein
MFRKLTQSASNNDITSFKVIFSNFETVVQINSSTIGSLGGSLIEAVIIKACQQTNQSQSVVRYLTDFYHKFFTKNRKPEGLMISNMDFWKSKIDEHCPELEYGTKYFPCVIRNLQSLYGNII